MLTGSNTRIETRELIMVPAIITLAVTLTRLAGELMDGPDLLFSPSAGGGGALVGIAWLVPIFGIYFAFKLGKAGMASCGAGRVVGYALLALAAMVVLGLLIGLLQPSPVMQLVFFAVVSIVGMLIVRRGWPELFSALFAYGLAARIPVVAIMFIAIASNWGTHYDAPPPDFPEMSWFWKWVAIGVVPQLTAWIAYTTVFGALFGSIGLAVAGRKTEAPAAG